MPPIQYASVGADRGRSVVGRAWSSTVTFPARLTRMFRTSAPPTPGRADALEDGADDAGHGPGPAGDDRWSRAAANRSSRTNYPLGVTE